MAWNVFFVFMCCMWLAKSLEGYFQPPRGSPVWGYFSPPVLHREPPYPNQSPLEAMADITNNLGVAILQDNTFSRGNFAFSPYGVASVLVVLYEGARGESARQIHRAVGFPSDKDIIRIGFRDIHRHLRSYFSHEGYLSGISLNKQASSLKSEYKKILRFYGYDIDIDPAEDDEDDGMGIKRPNYVPPEGIDANKTKMSTTAATTAKPGVTISSLDMDKKDKKPTSSDVGIKTTTKEAAKTTRTTAREAPKTTTVKPTTTTPKTTTTITTTAKEMPKTTTTAPTTTTTTTKDKETPQTTTAKPTTTTTTAKPTTTTTTTTAKPTTTTTTTSKPATTTSTTTVKPTTITTPKEITETTTTTISTTTTVKEIPKTTTTTAPTTTTAAKEAPKTTTPTPTTTVKEITKITTTTKEVPQTTTTTTTTTKEGTKTTTTATDVTTKETGTPTVLPTDSSTELPKNLTETHLAASSNNTKPTQNTTQPNGVNDESHLESTEFGPNVTDTQLEAISNAMKPTQGASQPDGNSVTATGLPGVANILTTIQPIQEEGVNNTTTLEAGQTTTESATTTTVLDLSADTETEKIRTTTEPGMTQSTDSELQTLSTVEIGSTITESQTNKEGWLTTTTENLQRTTTTPDLIKGQQEILFTTVPYSKVDARSVATTLLTTTKETETTEIKTEEFTNSKLDNGMLIPQADDFLLMTSTNKYPDLDTESTAGATTITYGTESTDENLEGTSVTQGTDSLPDAQRFPGGKNVIRVSGKMLDEEEEKRIRNIVDVRVPLWLDDKGKPRGARTITDYLKAPRSPDLSLQLQNGMYDTHVSRNADSYRNLPRLLFLVDGAIDTPVPMMTYTNVFPYAYIPKLHSKALEFPLDDIRYKLVILLPVERRGLRQLIYDLMEYPLRNVLDAMTPARVKAVVPTFMVEGFVILTSSLQKLGIWDVFDPRKANLSGMSMDSELYVRNVEQSVTVIIRNYVEILDIQTRTMAARYLEYDFQATHPFLYFVMDTATNVSLMAGQILDPLNSRIY